MNNLIPNTWYYTPICMFRKGTALNLQIDNTVTIPNRFLRPAYFRVVFGKQTKALTLEVLSPAEYASNWKTPLLVTLSQLPKEVLAYAFPKYAVALSKFKNSAQAAHYIADRMFKDREHFSHNHVDVMTNITAATLPEGTNTMYHVGQESMTPLLLSALMDVDTSNPILIRLHRSLERSEATWEEVLNFIQSGDYNA